MRRRRRRRTSARRSRRAGALAWRLRRSSRTDRDWSAERDEGFTDVQITGPQRRYTSEAESTAAGAPPSEPDHGPPEAEVEEATESDAGPAAAQPAAESYERVGSAAFDEHAAEVPAPQRLFNQGLFALGSEAFWGVREADGEVIVSQEFDRLQDGDGVRYVGSSEIDDDRTLAVPDVVLHHWDETAGGGTVVGSGTELVFVTSDDLEASDQVLVVPEHRVETLLGNGA